MKPRPRIYYSDSQKALMWERWKQGATLHQLLNRWFVEPLHQRMFICIDREYRETGTHQPTSHLIGGKMCIHGHPRITPLQQQFRPNWPGF